MILIIKRLLLAGASLLAMTAHASAAIPIGALLFAGPLGGIFSFQTLVAAVTLLPTIIGVGASVAGVVFGGRGKQQTVNPGEYRNVFETSEGSEVRAVGRVRVGGLKFFGNTSGLFRYRLIGHTKGPIDAVEDHFLGGRSVTVEADGKVSSPPWSLPGDSYIIIQSKVGDGTETAWSELVSVFSTWTTDHWVRGIAQSLVRYQSPGIATEKFLQLYQSGEPAYERVQRSELIYDPRQDSLNGGSGAHRVDTASTWTYGSHGDNGILAAVHIMRSYPELTSSDFDWTDIALEATKAEASTTTLTGTEERSRCWGFWQSEQNRGDVMGDVLRSIGAEVTMSDAGLIRIRLIDDTRTASVTFTERDIDDFDWKSGPDGVERPNICRVSYYSPERNYELAEIDLTGIAWASIPDEITRYGEKYLDINLPFCPSASQAQRIARRLFAVARADTGVIMTNMAGLAAWGEPTVNIELPDFGDAAVVCQIAAPRVDDEAGKVEIPFVVLPTLAAWNAATDEAAAPEQIPELAYESELDTPDVPSNALIVQYPDTSYEMRVEYTVPVGGTTTEATVRLYTAGVPGSWQSMTEVYAPEFAHRSGGTSGQDADFRVRIFDADSNGSYWSPTLNVTLAIDNTAPSMPTVGTAGNHAAIDFEVTDVDINVASVKLRRRFFEYPGPYGAFSDRAGPTAIRPGLQVDYSDTTSETWDPGDKVEWQVVPLTSDGTEGTPFSIEFEVVPAP